jgi:hypothetical protein
MALKVIDIGFKALCDVDDNVQIVGSICDSCDRCGVVTYTEWHTDVLPRSRYWPKIRRGPIQHICNSGPMLLIQEGDPVHSECDRKMEHIMAKVLNESGDKSKTDSLNRGRIPKDRR